MGERLREVSELTAGDGIVLLGEQPHVIAEVEEPLEQLACLVYLSLPGENLNEPERAREEHALARWEPVDVAVLVGEVTKDKAVDGELAADRCDGGDEPLVARRQEPDQGHQEDARVERVGAIGLRERLLSLAPGTGQNFGLDLVAELAPPFDGPLSTELLV